MKRRCPELRASAMSGQGLPSAGHARSCPECAAERAAMSPILALADSLPYQPPSADRIEEIRDRVLSLPPVSARGSRLLGLGWAAAALAIVTAVAASAIVADSTKGPALVLEAGPGAIYVRSTSSGEERVALQDGRLDLTITELEAHTFFLETGDAELEVHRAVFSVEAEQGRLSKIEVLAGLVELRRPESAPIQLGPGERWARPLEGPSVREAPRPSLAPEGSPAQVAEPPRARRSAPKLAPKAEVPGEPVVAPIVPANERAFRDAWAAFARGDLDQAIALFAEAERADPTATLAEDACYGRSVALERAGRREEAVAEMRRFLERFASSRRADEVAVALGWLLVERDPGEARRAFERGTRSPVDRVRSSAERGLESVDQRR